MKFQATLRMIWGLAKSPELSMSSEELHMFVEARTGKESLKELTQKEVADRLGISQSYISRLEKRSFLTGFDSL